MQQVQAALFRKAHDPVTVESIEIDAPRERTANAMMDLVGERQFIWGSDYPHIDSSIEAPQQIRASAAGLSEHRRRLLLGENARALFGL